MSSLNVLELLANAALEYAGLRSYAIEHSGVCFYTMEHAGVHP